MSPVGRAYLAEWEAARLAEREAQPITMTCLWCDWTLAGTLKAARDAHRAHRAAQHPERTVKRRRTRHRPGRPTIVTGGRSLDDNIAGARAQGANGSNEPEPELPAAEPEPAAPAAPAEQPPPTPIQPATTCVVDRCRMPPVARRGRYAGLCHEHRNQAARQPKKAA